jgi:hypothetical protein
LCGGQNPSLNCVSGEVVLDMKRMSHVLIDGPAKQAIVAGGTIVRVLDYELALQGLAVPSPIFSKIGVAGVTLGGGWGYLTKKYGLLCDSVAEMEIVTASCEVLRINDQQNRDLFWAFVRFAGAGTLGVVTSITFRLVDAPQVVYHGLIWWPLSAAKSVVASLRKRKGQWTEDFIMYPIVESDRIACVVFCAGGSTIGIPFLDDVLRDVDTQPTANEISDKNYMEAQTSLDSFFPAQKCYQKARFLDDLSEDVVLLAITRMEGLGSEERKQTKVMFSNYFKDTGYLILVHACWSDPEMQKSMTLWSDSLIEDASKGDNKETGAPNYASSNTSLSELFIEDDKLQILKLKKKYDPDNFFNCNVFRSFQYKK